MTFSDTPTFICKDREAASFALKITHVPSNFDAKRLKTGWSVVVAGASKSGVVKDKQGFVEVPAEELHVRLFPVERVRHGCEKADEERSYQRLQGISFS